MARRKTCSLTCGSQARGLKARWINACTRLQERKFIYPDQIPEFDSADGQFRLALDGNDFYEILNDHSVHRYELKLAGKRLILEDISEVDPCELPGSAVVTCENVG